MNLGTVGLFLHIVRSDKMQVNKLTAKKIQELKAELKELKEIKLVKAKERLSMARREGDLSENDEFDSAKKEIKDIYRDIDAKENLLNSSEVLTDEEYYSSEVRVGSRVTIKIDGEVFEKNLSLSSGLDYLNNISPKSILGQALLGKDILDSFRYKDNNGDEHEVTVLDVM